MSMNIRKVCVTLVATALLCGCEQRIEIARTPCDELGKVTDQVAKADLEKRCGHGGPTFKPTPPKEY
ncbi:MAG: entry exclusion lipoprotein TrbK [Pseudomonadota bacterium]